MLKEKDDISNYSGVDRGPISPDKMQVHLLTHSSPRTFTFHYTGISTTTAAAGRPPDTITRPTPFSEEPHYNNYDSHFHTVLLNNQ